MCRGKNCGTFSFSSRRKSFSDSRMLSLRSLGDTLLLLLELFFSCPAPAEKRPGRQPIGEEQEVTQPLAHRSPGNGAPNFKGLPPGRKRTGTESGDTSRGVNDGDKLLHSPLHDKVVYSREFKTFAASALEDAYGRLELCCCKFRPRLSFLPSGGTTVC